MKIIELTEEEVRFLKEDLKEKSYIAKRNLEECIMVGYGFEPDLYNDSIGFHSERNYRLSKSILEKL